MYRRIKAILDIIFSFCAILVFLPVFLVIGFCVYLNFGHPIIFVQERPGFNEKVFKLYKFRTMHNRYDDNGAPLPDRMRTNSFGRWLRHWSLDELPQLFNILKGEMSFIGPRPLFVHYLPYYTRRELTRHSVRPGLTGLSQVNGRSSLLWDERLALDVQYVELMSFKLDCAIFLKTIIKVLKRSDISDAAPQGPLHQYRSMRT